MNANKIFQFLVPKDPKFFPLFEQASSNLVKGAEAMKELMSCQNQEQRLEIIKKIKEIENVGDDITHKTYEELNKTFITPFDREDIHKLTSSVDDVLDYINGSAQRIRLYKPKEFSKNFVVMADLILEACIEINKAVCAIKNLKEPLKIKESCIRINEIENLADDCYHETISDLFDNQKDAIELIKMKEIIQTLEKATDKAEDVSDVLKTIIVKIA